VMSFTRWGFDPPRESLRVVALARTALEQLGQTDAARHIAVVREHLQQLKGWGAQDTILVARRAFTDGDLDVLRKSASMAKMEVVYLPRTARDTPFRTLLETSSPAQFFDGYPFDVRPVSDDRPFFFYTVQARDLWQFVLHASRDTADYKVNNALPVLFGLVAISIVATLVILALPPLVLRHALPKARGAKRALLYFLFIGAGYILIQVALIQKFVLFLGHPTYALTVIIFSMLLSSGLGSFMSKRLIGRGISLPSVLVFVAAAVLLLSLAVGPVSESGVALALPLKVLIAVALISPLGFAMGMPFPTGLTLLEKFMPPAVRWAWSVNAAASVLGSAAAMFLAIYLGLKLTLCIGGGFYLAALGSLLSSPLRTRSSRTVF